MSDDCCPEHNCDIAACFDLEHQEGTMSGVAFEKEFVKAKGDKLFIDFLRPLAEHFWQAALAYLREPMACGHSRACLRDIPLEGTVKEDEVHGCLICEIERIHDEAMDLANKERDEAIKKAHALPQGRA